MVAPVIHRFALQSVDTCDLKRSLPSAFPQRIIQEAKKPRPEQSGWRGFLSRSVPYGIRTRVAGVKGRCPGPD